MVQSDDTDGASSILRFGGFRLDPRNRRLTDGDLPVELSARYLDALILLAGARGKLVSKQRFLDEVWQGVPVTDEALTQAIRTIRRALDDDPARPRFIETVPKHGYRFIAPVATGDAEPFVRRSPPLMSPKPVRAAVTRLGLAGTLGGGVAGAVGGAIYGSVVAPPGSGAGGLSALLVLLALTAVIGLTGGAGVAFGIGAAALSPRQRWSGYVGGGAAGGLLVGAVVELIGRDAFGLMLGRAPADFTGGLEGALLGTSLGCAAWLNHDLGVTSLPRQAAVGGLAGLLAGIAIPLLGGKMLGGSLALLASAFPESQLRFEAIGTLVGEFGFERRSELVTSGLEGLLFGACLIGAMALVRVRLRDS